jgi:uncharacterized protein YcsI (UPF0317 family)
LSTVPVQQSTFPVQRHCTGTVESSFRFNGPSLGFQCSVTPGEIPVFWACGVTPQTVLMETRSEFAITHGPGCMFVTDQLAEAP